MESKVKEYLKLYDVFSEQHKQIVNMEKTVCDVQEEIKILKNEQKEFDYSNPDVVIEYMKTYIDNSVEKAKKDIHNNVHETMLEVTKYNEKIKKNFDKVVQWLSIEKVKKNVYSASVNYEAEVNIKKAEQATGMSIFTGMNSVFSFLFRFDFLRFIPKVMRIVVAIVFWMILLMATGAGIMVTALLLAINVVVYILVGYSAKKFLSDNTVICFAIIDPNTLSQKLYDDGIARYMDDTVNGWIEEIEFIKKKGLQDVFGCNSLMSFVKNDLHEKHNSLEEKINSCNLKIEDIRKQEEQFNTELQLIIPKLKEKEKEVDSLVADSKHNNAVLSPYVSAGYSQHTIKGAKELIYFKHNYKPMLICYDNDTAKDGERFRKNAAKLIELFMGGFFQENYHAYINMWLVDFEGLYFPESRTKGLMKVVHTQQGVQQMFEELKAIREKVDLLVDGRISTINPARLASRENPIKYNIVYFIGYDFTTVDRELSQLFIGGENFGFLPIVFMKKTVAQTMENDDSSSRAFSRVVEKMKDNNQIYEFEELVPKFELDLVVSNQKRIIDEKVCVNKIMSMEEFVTIAESEEGLSVGEVLYMDTYQLSKSVYEAVADIDYVKFFTVNGEVPEFVTKNVIKL